MYHMVSDASSSGGRSIQAGSRVPSEHFAMLLDGWRNKLAAMSRNISELSDIVETPAFMSLKKRMRSVPEQAGAMPNLTDAEARAWASARDELWDCMKVVGEVIDRAESMVGAAWPWQKETAAKEAALLFSSPCVEFRKDDIPILRRGLLDRPGEFLKLTMTEATEVMARTFEDGKRRLMDITAAEKSAADAVERLRAMCPEGTESITDSLLVLVAEDPLRALMKIEKEILPGFAGIAEQQRVAAAEKTDRSNVMKTAREKLDSLISGERELVQAAANAASKVSDIPPVQSDPAPVRELAAWLDRLAAIEAAGRYDAWSKGMNNWLVMHAGLDASLGKRKAAVSVALERRAELRERFEAVQSKRRSRLISGAADFSDAENRAAVIKNMLFGNATPLGEVEPALQAFEAAVSRMNSGSRSI